MSQHYCLSLSNPKIYCDLGNCNPTVVEALNEEKPIIANLLIDHIGHSFISGKFNHLVTSNVDSQPVNTATNTGSTVKSEPVTNTITSSVKSQTTFMIFSEMQLQYIGDGKPCHIRS